jgi:hypothetical protein
MLKRRSHMAWYSALALNKANPPPEQFSFGVLLVKNQFLI